VYPLYCKFGLGEGVMALSFDIEARSNGREKCKVVHRNLHAEVQITGLFPGMAAVYSVRGHQAVAFKKRSWWRTHVTTVLQI